MREAAEVADAGLAGHHRHRAHRCRRPASATSGPATPLTGFPTARAVTEFVEKPDAERARAYVASGEYRWNAGMFVARATVLLDLLAEQHPDLADGPAGDRGRPVDARGPLARAAPRSPSTTPSPSPRQRPAGWRWCPGPFGWEDVGDFASLGALTAPDENGVRILGDESLVVAVGRERARGPAGGRTVAVVGLDDVVVVDTGDALLVTSYQRAQDVKAVVDELQAPAAPT